MTVRPRCIGSPSPSARSRRLGSGRPRNGGSAGGPAGGKDRGQGAEGVAAMADRGLFGRSQFRGGAVGAVDEEDRVVTEAALAAGLADDLTVHAALDHML